MCALWVGCGGVYRFRSQQQFASMIASIQQIKYYILLYIQMSTKTEIDMFYLVISIVNCHLLVIFHTDWLLIFDFDTTIFQNVLLFYEIIMRNKRTKCKYNNNSGTNWRIIEKITSIRYIVDSNTQWINRVYKAKQIGSKSKTKQCP